MTIKIGIVMDPLPEIHYEKDSTLAMLFAAKKRGWELFYMQMPDLYQYKGKAMGVMAALEVVPDPDNWYFTGEKVDTPLDNLDVILMRKDPPVDHEFIYCTYLLEQAEKEGVLVVNRPQSLRDFNEKLFATYFPQAQVPCIVSRDMQRLKQFAKQEQEVVFKPIEGMGGYSVFHVSVNDHNLNVILETLTQNGQTSIIGQKFIPEIKKGDKRILMIDGEPVPYALARVPAEGEFRGNLAAGGTGVGQPLSARDRWITQQVGPVLREKGILFAGLDVIGDYLTEINITSPTCIRQLDHLYDLEIATQLMNKIEIHLQAKSLVDTK